MIPNYNHLVSAETFNRVRKLHKEFVDEMHPHFGVENPTYVKDIRFSPLLFNGLYCLDKRNPIILLHEAYVTSSPISSYFNSLELDLTIFHESGHHLHVIKHKEIFEDKYVLELIIDYSMVHYLKSKDMKKHLENLEGDCKLAVELHDQICKRKSLKYILTASEKEARKFLEEVLGKNHKYFKESED